MEVDGQHFIERCVCGLVVRQCRCPSPNKVTVTIDPCTHTDAEKQRGRQDHPPTGYHFHGIGLQRMQHEDHPDRAPGAHVHEDMAPDTFWMGNPEDVGLTDDPEVELDSGPSIESGQGFVAIPWPMLQQMQLREAALGRMIQCADKLADVTDDLLAALMSLAIDHPDRFTELQLDMWPVAGYLVDYWRTRAGVIHGETDDDDDPNAQAQTSTPDGPSAHDDDSEAAVPPSARVPDGPSPTAG